MSYVGNFSVDMTDTTYIQWMFLLLQTVPVHFIRTYCCDDRGGKENSACKIPVGPEALSIFLIALSLRFGISCRDQLRQLLVMALKQLLP